MKRRKMTEIQKHHLECTNCYRCGWRTPIHNNPVGCLFNIMSGEDMKKSRGKSQCEMYVTDTILEKHLKSIFRKAGVE